MIPTLVAAQSSVRDAWSCKGSDANGYSWNGSTWERQSFATRSWEFTFAGNRSRQTINGEQLPFTCTNDRTIKQCSYQGVYFMFNTDTRRGALSDLFGVAINPDGYPQIFIELVECTRNGFGFDTYVPATPVDRAGITAPPAERAETSLETRLRELEKLKNDGLISEQEYQKARSAALGL